MTEKITTLRYQLNYEDGSGPRAAVSYDSEYKLSKDKPEQRYIKIEGIGGNILIDVRDLGFVADALDSIKEVL